jgi:hypothetical protein
LLKISDTHLTTAERLLVAARSSRITARSAASSDSRLAAVVTASVSNFVRDIATNEIDPAKRCHTWKELDQ